MENIQGINRVIKAARKSKTVDEYIRELTKWPRFYLQNDFLKRQGRPFFVDVYQKVKANG